MKQVVIERGEVVVEQVPVPACRPGFVLVRVTDSLLSAGTERASLAASSQPLLKRVLKQPEKVSKAARMARDRGVMTTWRIVQGEGLGGSQIGYSCAGLVVEVGEGISDIAPGDQVACGGAGYANHAEYVCVPRNLVAKVPAGVDGSGACTATVGAIALQGVRRAAPQLGERIVVLGLGLIGQLTIQLLRAGGARVAGIDLDSARLACARQSGAEVVFDAASPDMVTDVVRWTGGLGADSVLLTAATPSDEPIRQAMQMVRKRGKVVVVGDVGLALARSPFYEKEAELLISCSYGPGRYDPEYEEGGVDYPPAYVRWTENRNMAAFLDLLGSKAIDLSKLKPQAFPATQPELAYRALGSPEKALLVLLSFDHRPRDPVRQTIEIHPRPRDRRLGVAVIGTGGFALDVHLPNLAKLSKQARVVHVVSQRGHSALRAAKLFGIPRAGTDAFAAISDPAVDAVIITTRHDSHAALAIAAAEAGKAVFVEKPLGLSLEQVDQVLEAITRRRVPFTVGYNRRFAPASVALRRLMDVRQAPIMCIYRVNAGFLSDDSWIQKAEGGGRIIGELCHILDFVRGLTKSAFRTIRVSAATPLKPYRRDDNVVVSIEHDDGSTSALVYTSLGHPELPKEFAEMFWGNKAAQLFDYTRLDLFGMRGGWSGRQDKGHAALIRSFVDHCRGGSIPISLDEIREVSAATFTIEAALREASA